jgi:hypothetical protein
VRDVAGLFEQGISIIGLPLYFRSKLGYFRI